MSTDIEQMILSSIRDLSDRVSDMQNQRYENGLKASCVENTVKNHEIFIQEHKKIHEDTEKNKKAVNMKLWLILITALVGFMFAVLKDSII